MSQLASPPFPSRRPAQDSDGLTLRGDRRFRPDIQGLRALAILLVVLYHAGLPGLTAGYVGVDVFFVISGFLITRQLIAEVGRTGTVSLSGFYARRIRRLLPAALLVILSTVIVARIWGPALQATETAKDGLFSTLYAMNFWLAVEQVDYQNAGSGASPLQHFWSLAVEEQFYLVWPLLILIVAVSARGPFRRLRPFLVIALVLVIIAASLMLSIRQTGDNAPLAYFSLFTRAWEFGVGALVAVVAPLFLLLPGVLAAVLSWVGLAAILGAAVVFDDSTPFPGALALIPALGAAAIIAAGVAERRGGAETVLRPRPMQFFGAVSYSWYLWHWPFIVLAPSIFGSPLSWGENLAMAFLALWFAVLTYLGLEQLSRRVGIDRSRWFAIGASGSAAVAAICIACALIVPTGLRGVGDQADALRLSVGGPTDVGRVLGASLTTDLVPSNLEPALTDAAADKPVTSSNGCHLAFTETTQDDCVFGDPGARRTILLFGDSHAEQWFGALDRFAATEGWQLVSWTKAACPVAKVELYNGQIKRDYTECTQWRDESIARISALDPEIIIASQADSLGGAAFPDKEWAEGTADTVRALAPLTGQLVLIADTPFPSKNVPDCLADHLALATACILPSFAAAETGSDAEYLRDRRAAVATSMEDLGVPVIDPTAWFCTTSMCPPIVDNTLVYRDNSHMTQAYSRALTPLLALELEPYLLATGGEQ